MFKKAIIFALTLSLLLLSGCGTLQNTQQRINWQMHGTTLSGGEFVGTVDFSVKGTLKIKASEKDSLQINAVFPDSFQYIMNDIESPRIGETEFSEPYFVGASYIYDRNKNDTIFCMYAICPEKEYMIFALPDQPDTYLVASVNPETDAREILEYFDAFIQEFIAPQKEEIQLPLSLDWAMTAYQITPEGDVEESFPITVKGDIWEESDRLYLGMDINWGDSFRYKYIVNNSGCDISLNHPTDKMVDFCAATHTYDREDNAPAFCYYSVAPEKEYFIAYWGEDFGHYLVAATDPDAAPADILAYFADCLPYFIIKYG